MIRRLASGGVILVLTVFTGHLLAMLLAAPPALGSLGPAVAAAVPVSGVSHPVTAILLNVRAYDTLLEVAVLLSALLGVLVIARPPPRTASPHPSDAVLEALAQWLVPALGLSALYLLWAGAHRPGGAFQAAALLGGAAVLAHLARQLPAWSAPGPVRRAFIALGLAGFIACALPLQVPGVLLALPTARAGTLILLIECGLTVSLGLLLAALFLCLTDGHEPASRAGDDA